MVLEQLVFVGFIHEMQLLSNLTNLISVLFNANDIVLVMAS